MVVDKRVVCGTQQDTDLELGIVAVAILPETFVELKVVDFTADLTAVDPGDTDPHAVYIGLAPIAVAHLSHVSPVGHSSEFGVFVDRCQLVGGRVRTVQLSNQDCSSIISSVKGRGRQRLPLFRPWRVASAFTL